MTRAEILLRTALVLEFAAALLLWALGVCPWGVSCLVASGALVAFMSRFPEPAHWTAASDAVRAPASSRARYAERKRRAPAEPKRPDGTPDSRWR